MSFYELHFPLTPAPIHKFNKEKSLNKSIAKTKIIPRLTKVKSISELNIIKILGLYKKLSLNKLDYEEKIQFANYLTNLYINAKKVTKANDVNTNINVKEVNQALKLMKSKDIHDVVIGIDNFISIAHTTSLFLPIIVLAHNGLILDIDALDEDDYYEMIDWESHMSALLIPKLDEIRNDRGLTKIQLRVG